MKLVERLFSQPAQAIATSFLAMVMVGTAVLSLPFATAGPERAPFVDALFTATSAVCVTGLTTVDTGTYWSTGGQVAIAVLIQVGGLGIMTLATLVAVIFFRRMGLHTRMAAQTETRSFSAGDLRRIVRRIVVFSLVVEGVLAVVLATRFLTAYDMSPGAAAYSGGFHAVSSFNNAGFSIYSDNLVGFAKDPLILFPIALAVIIGGLGFPVVFELLRSWRRPRQWSALTRVTVVITSILLILATVALYLSERGNAATWGTMDVGEQWLASFFSGVMPRTAGFNIVDISAMRSESLAFTDVLMFIGGGSAGTAGGLKVTTLGVLALTVWAELRGKPDVEIGHRRIGTTVQRQSLAVAALGAILVVIGTSVLLMFTSFTFEQVFFESVSAFGTVGLSTGITADLPNEAKYALVVLMFAGRVGPLTFASALASRGKTQMARRPEERMSIG